MNGRIFDFFDMNFFTELWESIVNAFNSVIGNIDVIIYGAIKIILVIILARVIIRIVSLIIKKSLKKKALKKPDSLTAKKCDTMISLSQSLIRYLIDFVMVVMILDILGLGGTIGSLLATAGIGGVALGLGAQSFLKDLIGGLFMLFDDEYAVGDYIKLPNQNIEGTVSSISMRTTSLRLVNGQIATIPHGTIDIVVNYTRDSYALFLNYDIASDEDDEAVSAIVLNEINDWLKENNLKNGEAAYLGISSMNPLKTTLKFMFRLPPMMQWQAERDLNKKVRTAFKNNKINLPEYQKGVLVVKE